MGFCGESSALRIACAAIHFGEEPPVTGSGGSGAVFITGCSLHCGFCQNAQISHNGMGQEVSTVEFVNICLALQQSGAENINIVTGSHAAPAVALGIECAKKNGLTIPCLWNSSAYESISALDVIQDIADSYLPDLKTLNKETAQKYLTAQDYPLAAKNAITKMIKTKKNVIIRHLVLPDHLEDTKNVFWWIAENAASNVKISLMTQYTPIKNNHSKSTMPNRFLNEGEYETVLKWLDEFGIKGFFQELVTNSAWLPDFSKTKSFPSSLSKTVWHWKDGFCS
ncbi:radical SAM protein [Spirochaetia bacterium]|nr:radical SAM protein [Spirochaetia bacterium]